METGLTKTSDRNQTQLLVLTALIVAASCLRLFVCFQHNPLDYLWSDPLRHWMNGRQFPRGGFWGASDPIGYQAFIYIMRRLTGENRVRVALVCGLLSVLMPWVYYRAARSLGFAKMPALWVWTLIAWTPSLFVVYHYIMMETLLLAVDGAAIWATGRYLRKGDAYSFLVSIFCWTFACLTKPTVIPLAGVFVLWSCWKKIPSMRAAVAAALLIIAMLLPQAVRTKLELGFVAPFGNPWLTRIQHRSGTKITYIFFHGSAHPNELDHYWVGSPTCFIQPLAPLSDWRIRRAYADTSTSITAASKDGERDWKNAYDALNTSWDEWLEQWGENVTVFFFAPSWPESVSDEWDGHLTSYTRWLWAPLIVLVLIWNGSAFLRRHFQLLPVAVTVFTLLLALQNVVTAEGRYRKPLEPLLLMNLVWLISTRNRAGREKSESRA